MICTCSRLARNVPRRSCVQPEVFKKISRHEFDGVVNRHIQLVDESIGGSLAVDLEHPFGDRIAVGAAFMSEHRMD